MDWRQIPDNQVDGTLYNEYRSNYHWLLVAYNGDFNGLKEDLVDFGMALRVGFNNRVQVPHMAIARVILHDSNGNKYVYPIPHLFLSGVDVRDVFDKLKNMCVPYNFLNVCKTIGVFRVGVSSAQSFAHSERAVMTKIFNTRGWNNPLLKLILKHFVETHQNIRQNIRLKKIEIQIKTVKDICNLCKNFLNEYAKYKVNNNGMLEFCNANVEYRPYNFVSECKNIEYDLIFDGQNAIPNQARTYILHRINDNRPLVRWDTKFVSI